MQRRLQGRIGVMVSVLGTIIIVLGIGWGEVIYIGVDVEWKGFN